MPEHTRRSILTQRFNPPLNPKEVMSGATYAALGATARGASRISL
jgi:hypothetical protein